MRRSQNLNIQNNLYFFERNTKSSDLLKEKNPKIFKKIVKLKNEPSRFFYISLPSLQLLLFYNCMFYSSLPIINATMERKIFFLLAQKYFVLSVLLFKYSRGNIFSTRVDEVRLSQNVFTKQCLLKKYCIFESLAVIHNRDTAEQNSK